MLFIVHLGRNPAGSTTRLWLRLQGAPADPFHQDPPSTLKFGNMVPNLGYIGGDGGSRQRTLVHKGFVFGCHVSLSGGLQHCRVIISEDQCDAVVGLKDTWESFEEWCHLGDIRRYFGSSFGSSGESSRASLDRASHLKRVPSSCAPESIVPLR